MGATENKQLIQTMFEELSAGNPRAFLDALADDVDFELIGTTKFSGRFDKQKLVDRVLAPLGAELDGGITMHVKRLIAEGEYVVMEGQGESVTKSGTPYNNTYVQVFRITDGKIRAVTEYLDTELVNDVFGK